MYCALGLFLITQCVHGYKSVLVMKLQWKLRKQKAQIRCRTKASSGGRNKRKLAYSISNWAQVSELLYKSNGCLIIHSAFITYTFINHTHTYFYFLIVKLFSITIFKEFWWEKQRENCWSQTGLLMVNILRNTRRNAMHTQEPLKLFARNIYVSVLVLGINLCVVRLASQRNIP